MRNTLSAWADLAVPSSFGRVTRNGVPLTSAAGAFHVQPETNSGCATPLSGGLCLDDGTRATADADRNLRYDSATYPLSLLPSLVRRNIIVSGHYALSDEVEVYGELGWYQANTRALQSPVFTIGSTKVVIPASNYWNPFGATTLPDGSPNPNRLSDLNVPAAGLPVTLNNYRFMDLGPRLVKAENTRGAYWVGCDVIGMAGIGTARCSTQRPRSPIARTASVQRHCNGNWPSPRLTATTRLTGAIWLFPPLAEIPNLAARLRWMRSECCPHVAASGTTLAQLLNLIETFPLQPGDAGSAKAYHLIAEATHLTSAGRSAFSGGPRSP